MRKSKAVFLWILPVIWMAVIFAFSNQPSDDSSQLSGEVAKVIESIAEFMHINTARFDLHLSVRKAAHFTEFAILGLLFFIAIYPAATAAVKEETARQAALQKATAKAGLLSQAAGMGYAVMDEIHQIYVPGRSCQVKDMFIDSSGVLLAVLLCYALLTLKRHMQNA